MKVMENPLITKNALSLRDVWIGMSKKPTQSLLPFSSPPNTITLQMVMGLISPNIGRYGMPGLEQMKFLALTGL